MRAGDCRGAVTHHRLLLNRIAACGLGWADRRSASDLTSLYAGKKLCFRLHDCIA
jgi:hypothetical protein